jgi:hypothetical protein
MEAHNLPRYYVLVHSRRAIVLLMPYVLCAVVFVKAGWPSWLWRQVKVTLIQSYRFLVRETERGFKSHSCQDNFFSISFPFWHRLDGSYLV